MAAFVKKDGVEGFTHRHSRRGGEFRGCDKSRAAEGLMYFRAMPTFSMTRHISIFACGILPRIWATAHHRRRNAPAILAIGNQKGL